MSFRSFFRHPQMLRKARRANHRQPARRPRFEPLEDRRLMAITVNTLTDELDGSIVDGDISLRDAIAAAPVGETIDFSVTGAINLTLGPLTIGKNLTVTGPGANQLTINAGGASRVLEITAGTVSVSGLTLTGGNGGGVVNSANTTLTGVVIQGNSGAYTGGGVWNRGALKIVDSTISGNSASWGGGVYNANSLAIENSTISGNSAGVGGGVFSYDYFTSTTISNCTISGNSVSTWGGGIASWYFTTTTLSHTLVAGNSAPEGSELYSPIQGSPSAVVNLNAFNLIGDSSKTTAQALVGVTAGATDILATSNGTNPTAAAAILGPLANNGGPTKTHALVAGSPAINGGNPMAMAGSGGVPLYDQRGNNFGRVQNGRIDIGAFEFGVPAPPPGSISVSDATVIEGNTGTKNATFTVSLSSASSANVSVHYATANGSALAGSDYIAKSGTVTIPAGQLSRTFTVAIQGDRLVEPTETFYVNLSNPTNATIFDGQSIGTILDDEPRISINDVSKNEGHSKTTTFTFTFTVSLSNAYDQAVSVNYATANGTASAGSDYLSKTGTITFAPGETTKTITVTVNGDRQKEANETFFVNLSGAVGGQITDSQGLGTIWNDDSGGSKGKK